MRSISDAQEDFATLVGVGPARRQELRRSLGLFDLIVYGLIFIIPVAPMATFGIVYNLSHGMVPLIYAVGLVLMGFTAFSYVTMSREFPVAGSVYAYAGSGIGEFAGYLAGWSMLLDYVLTPVVIYVLIAVAVQAIFPETPRAICIIAAIAFNTIVNLLGIEATARLNRILLSVQLAVLAVFLLLASIALARGVADAHLSLAPFFRPEELSAKLILGGLSIAVLSFLGFDAISTLSEETRDGPSVIGAATMWSLGLAAIFFIAQTYLGSLFVLDRTSFPPGEPTDGAIYGIAELIGGAWFKVALSLKFFCAGLPAALAAQAATARIIFGMARDGSLPRPLAHIHPVRKVPHRAILLVAIVNLGLGLLAANQLPLFASMLSFGALFGFLLLHLSVVVHFAWRKGSRRWLRHLIAPAIGFATIAFVLANIANSAKIAGVCWLGLGALASIAFRFGGRKTAG